MTLTYDYLKENVVMVEVMEDLHMGDIEDFLDQTNGLMVTGLEVNENDEAIIVKGAIGKFNVQPYNNWYEMTIDGYSFDVAVEEDELNKKFKLISVEGPNKYFVKGA